jgi:hypothetical protein
MPSGNVALLDVLGFSALVAADAADERIERYLGCLKRTTGGTTPPIDYVVFSDSIVLTVEGEGTDSLVAIAGACSRLMGELLAEHIAIRGAIAYGHFVRSAIGQSVFVAGRAIIDAYQFEQLQDWIGMMIAPSARERVPDLEQRCQLQGRTTVEAFREVEPNIQWPAFIQRCYNIPFHTENPFDISSFDGFAVVPTNGLLEPVALRDSIQASIDRLSWLRAIAPTPGAQQKYQKTGAWLRTAQGLWHEVAFFRQQARQG